MLTVKNIEAFLYIVQEITEPTGCKFYIFAYAYMYIIEYIKTRCR
jgi:hypothetical protein